MRRLGLELGLPESAGLAPPVPRPRPGGALPRRGDAPTGSNVLRQADAILLDELKQAGWYRQTAQAFAVLLPVQSRRRDGRWPDV